MRVRTYLSPHLLKSLGALVRLLGDPASFAQINDIHEHEHETARQALKMDNGINALEVGFHEGTALLRAVQVATDSLEQLGERLNLGLIGDAVELEQLAHTLVHDALREHVELVELTDELHETQAATLGGRGNV